MMKRFMVVGFLLASAAGAQTLSDPFSLTTATRIPSFRDTSRIVAARASDGFVVVWKEAPVLRMKRLSSRGDVIAEGALQADLDPICVATNGDETLVSVASDSRAGFVRIHADGRMTAVPVENPPFGVSQLVPLGDGYLGTWNPPGGGVEIVRLDLDGRVVARITTALSNLLTLVSAGDRTLLLAVAGNVLHGSTIGPDLSISNDVILSAEIAEVQVSASADRPGELAVATNTPTGLAVLLFDSQFRSTGRIALPAPPLYVTGPTIAWSGNSYVVAIPSGNVMVVTIDAQRRLETISISNLGIPPPLVSGIDGALLAVIPSLPPRASFVIVGASGPALPPRSLADAEPDQRWPRIARVGGRVVIAWDESTGVNTTLMAAIFDPKERRIVAGPVELAHDGVGELGDELAVASNGNSIAIAWSAGSSHLVLLSPDLRTVASRSLAGDEHIHDLIWTGSEYITAQGTTQLEVSRLDANLQHLADSQIMGLDAFGGFSYSDARLSLGTSDALLLANNWYQLLCWCGEGPWHIAVARFSPFYDSVYWPRIFATANVSDVKRKMSGFVRVGDRLLLFFPRNTEVRSVDTLAQLTTIPNDALTQELPLGSIGQAAVDGSEIVATFGNTVEFFKLDGTPIATLPLDDTANDAQFAAGAPFVIANDALASSGSRRINVRLLDFVPAPRHRAAGH